MIKYKQFFECDSCHKSIIASRINQICILEKSSLQDEYDKEYSVLQDKKLDFCNTCLNSLINKFISGYYDTVDLSKPEKFKQSVFVEFLLESIDPVK